MKPVFAPVLLGLLLLTGCANQRPFVYRDAGVQALGQSMLDADIQRCETRAQASGLAFDGGGHPIARRTATAGVVGGATGAVTGAIFGSAGKGAAAGAAAYATRGLLWGLFAADAPAPLYRNFVNHCLRDKGYQPIGWK